MMKHLTILFTAKHLAAQLILGFTVLPIAAVYSQLMILGPAEVQTGSTETYSCPDCSMFSEFGTQQYWNVTNGTIINSNSYNSVTIQWSGSAGTGTIRWRDKWTIYTERNITIGGPPDTPPTPTVQHECTQGRLLFNGTPPSETTWYWQTTSSGTDMSNSANEWVVTSNDT
jgi:hypothetical protein